MFVLGEHAHLFACVAQLYKESKTSLDIVGPIPIILADDETKVKSRVA